MITRSDRFEQIPLNIVGSSTFGRYPKISLEKTYNMFVSDNFMVPYAGYQAVIDSHLNKLTLGQNGRAVFSSTILNKLIVVTGNRVYAIAISFLPNSRNPFTFTTSLIGMINSFTSDVYIAENNAGQIAISDQENLYIYNPVASPTFKKIDLSFVPGYITFHDTYFICAASEDTFYSPPANNTWRLSAQNDGTSWPDDAASIGLIETKPDRCVGVTRFPSRGNMIFVFGQTVTESWFDVGAQLFPYQRNNQFNIDYGCVSPSTIAATDELVVWLAQNEKSGPIIMASDGGMPEKITTDGIDYLFSQLKAPADSEAFIYRQDGHIFYHINFYTDNLSLFYDFSQKKFYHASDENTNYFIAKEVAFLNNQYYFVTKNNGHLYAFDTIFTTYDGAIIPRVRVCKPIRKATQEYFIANDIGFTIEQGIALPQVESTGPIYMITEDGNRLITEGGSIQFITEDGKFLITEDGENLISEQNDDATDFLIYENDGQLIVNPRVDFTFSIDGGETFSNGISYNLNRLGVRRNMLRWWGLGLANDFTAQFRFWGLGRFVATDGILNVRQ